MNNEKNSTLFDEEARDSAMQSAGEYLTNSSSIVSVLLDGHFMGTAEDNPVLVASHALLSLLDFKGERIATALENIAESLDFIAAQPDPADLPDEHEKMVIYRALEERYLRRVARRGSSSTDANCNAKELEAALSRFKRIAGL